MDPVSIVGLASSVVSIVSVIAKNVNALSTLQAKYRNADLSVFLLIGQLSTLKAALGQISEWIKIEDPAVQSEHLLLVEDLEVALNGCQVLITILDDRVDQLANKEDSDSLNFQGKIIFLWEEQELNVYVTHLNNQVNALNLLISAIRCRSSSQERTLLQSLESRQVIQRLKDDTSSLLWLKDSESILSRKTISTTNSKLLDTVFDFDGEVFNSKAYQEALRSNMKHVLSHKALGHSKPSNLAFPPTDDTFLLEKDEAGVDIETTKANSVSDTPLIVTPVYQDPNQSTTSNVSPLSLLFERIVSRKKSQLGTPNETIKSKEGLLPQNIQTLILGTSENRKYTTYKSLMLHIEGSFTLEEERQSLKDFISNTAIQSMRIVLEAMKGLGLSCDNIRNEHHAKTIFRHRRPFKVDNLPTKVMDAVTTLYTDSGVRKCLKRKWGYQIPDVAQNSLCWSIWHSNLIHVPPDEEILRSKFKSTGFENFQFNTLGPDFVVFKMGGITAERLRMHCYENVGTILLTAEIACFGQILSKDQEIARMQEALDLFDSIVDSKWFVCTTFALFFTKYDKLAEKLKTSPMKKYFPDFKGGNDLQEARTYITDRFASSSKHKSQNIEFFDTSIIDDERNLGKTTINFLQREMFN